MKYTTSATIKTVGFLAALSMLLSACNPPATPTTTAAPTSKPAMTVTSGPTSTPAPSPTPRPPVNPALIDREPARGQELQVDKPIVLTFDQAMDRSSVEQSVQVLNNASGKSVAGRFTWKNDATASFLPGDTANWDRATQYTISLKDSAKSARGLALARPQSFNISTIGYLDVAQTIPSAGAKEVAADARITVLFNRPVVPLTAIGQQDQLPSPVKFTPDIEGKGEWLNTSIFLFRPSKPLAAGIEYRGVVAAGLKDTTGALLQKEFSWSFSVAAPTIKALSPEDTTFDVDLHRPISITFSQKMDHASAEAAFKITPAVQGTFQWVSEQVDKNQGPQYKGDKRQLAVGTPPQAVAAAGEVMAFVPATAFERNTNYKVEISAGARALLGSSGTPALRSFSFTTIKLPGVASTVPANGDNKADSSNGVTIRFTAPVIPEMIVPNLHFEPALTLTKVYSYYDAHDKSFYLNLQLQPSTAYKLTIGGDIADQYGVKIGKDKIVQFTTAPLIPYAVLNSNGTIGTYDASKPTKLFTTYRNVSKLNLELATLTPEQFYQMTGADGSFERLRSFIPDDKQVVRRWAIPTSAGLNEVAFASVSLAADGGSLAPGIYLLTLTAPEAAATVKYYEPARHILVVSNLHITLKQAEREALVWVTNLQDGKPEAGLTVSFRDKSFNEIKKGTIANDGQLLSKFEGAFEEYTPFYAVISEPGKNNFGIAYNRWDTGINPYDFGLATQFGSARYMAYLYTERPIYRPGQMVYYKGIVRSEDDARYTLASGISSTDITINNDQGQQVFSTTLPVSANGTFSGSFALDNAASTGYYYVQTCLPFDTSIGYKGNGFGSFDRGIGGALQCRSYSVQFQVAAYRLPEFEVVVKPAKTDYLAGDTLNASVDAKFFFGGNVSDAKVQWTLFARDYYFDRYKGSGNYSFGDFDSFYRGVSYNEQVANGIGKTDANGHLDITASADISKRKNSAVYSLEVSVTDANDQSVSGRAEATIHKSVYYLGIAPEDYVGASGREMKFNVLSVDWQGQPIADKSATVSYYQREWFTTVEQDKAGNSAYTSVPSDTLASTSDIKTDANGKAVSSLTPKAGGEYRAVVKGEGAAGPVSAASVYVSSGGEYVGWRVNNNDRIDLKTDRQEYKVGDTVKLLVPSPYSGTVTALLTLERGRFLMHKVVVLKSNSDIIEIPVEAGYAPNAFATVVLVKGVDADNPVPAYKVGMVGFKVDPGQFALHVDVATVQQTYAPRDTVTYDIRVTDSSGNPVKAELSLAVVDKAVLSLSDPNSLPILDAFYGARGLGVHTADSLNINVDRITARIIAENAKGGGGGGLAGALDSSGFTRQNFKDVAFWAAVVNTDENGKASVQVRLPDNLTTWTMDARAITTDSKAGQASKEIVSTKPLLIRPVAPRFFVVGDRVTLGAVVNNNTDRDLQATATLDAKGVTIADAA
ncbi:MAG TPA: Ig-like domain-containing protein, partial [Armatimonadota bacterium]